MNHVGEAAKLLLEIVERARVLDAQLLQRDPGAPPFLLRFRRRRRTCPSPALDRRGSARRGARDRRSDWTPARDRGRFDLDRRRDRSGTRTGGRWGSRSCDRSGTTTGGRSGPRTVVRRGRIETWAGASARSDRSKLVHSLVDRGARRALLQRIDLPVGRAVLAIDADHTELARRRIHLKRGERADGLVDPEDAPASQMSVPTIW